MVSGLLGTGSALLGSLASVDEARDPRVAAPLLLAPSPAGRAVGRLPEALLRPPAGCLRTPRDRHLSGPHQLLDPDRPQELDDGGELRLVAGDLQGERHRRDVDDLGPEDVGDAEDLRAVLG